MYWGKIKIPRRNIKFHFCIRQSQHLFPNVYLMTHRNCPLSRCFYPWCKTWTFISATSELYRSILSVTNSTLWNHSCTSNHIPRWWFSFPFLYTKVQSSASSVLLSSHLTSFTHTKSNQYFASSLTTVFSALDIGKLFTYHTYTFLCLGDSKWYAQVQGPMLHVITRLWRVRCWLLAPYLTIQLDHHPLPTVHNCLTNIYIYELNKLNQKRFSKLPMPGPAAVTQR
jgi:hypothetical protein